MTELRNELRRASHTVAPPDQALEEMLRRGEQRRRASRVGTAAFALTLSMLVLGGAVFGLTRLGGGGTGRVADGADLAMTAGQFHYLEIRYVGPGLDTDGFVQAPYDSEIEMWWGLDDAGRVRVARAGGGYGLPEPATYGPGEFPYETEGITEVSDLSTDPAVLAEQLTRRSATAGASPQPDPTPGPGQTIQTGQMVRAITDLLAWPNVTPELRQALFEVAAGLPTVERNDGAQDPVGRDAIGLTITTEEITRSMYFDPATRLWMGTVETFAGGGPNYELVLASGFSGSTDEVPSGEAVFFPGPQHDLATP
jgi:hypothetical protein